MSSQDDSFFAEAKEQSQIKAAIVAKYFFQWAKIIIPRSNSKKVLYLDLFAGPGRYDDETKSTPIIVLEHAINDDSMRESLITVFNDKNASHVDSLNDSISKLPGIEKLKYKPDIHHSEVDASLAAQLEQTNLVPTFSFIDPFGYRGLSKKLINAVIKDWGSDCVIFFSYNSINRGISNSYVEEHMDALFGEERAKKLRGDLEKAKFECEKTKQHLPSIREPLILEAILESLEEMGAKYSLPFRFEHKDKARTSHYLIFASKNPLGYKIMKDIMASVSERSVDGVASFEYIPEKRRQTRLFAYSKGLEDLKSDLLSKFSGQTILLNDIFESTNVGTPFVVRNYQDAILELEQTGIVSCEPAWEKRRMRLDKKTINPKTVKVKFP